MTYQQDREIVAAELQKLHERGNYSQDLQK